MLGGSEAPWRRRPIVFVLVLAAVLRLVYLSVYLVELPFAYGPLGDSVVYLLQAREIAHGSFGTPAQLAFSPAYGYLLALLCGGRASLLPILLQLAAGVLNIALLYRLALRFFDQRAALTSALLMAGYATLLFLESKLLTETLGLSLALAGMLAFCPDRGSRRELPAALAAGALLALAVLMRASLVFCLPCFVLCALPAPPAASRRERLAQAAAIALGASLVLGANGAWNLVHSGRFVPVILVSRTLEKSTQHAWNGSIMSYGSAQHIPSPFDVVEQAASALAAPASSAPEPSLAARLSSFDVASYLRGAPRKLFETFQNRETFHEYGFLGERDALPILRALPVSFGLIALLGLLGAVALWRAARARELWLLAPLVLGTLATTTLYHPSSRYRLPLIIPLTVLAGHGVWATLRSGGRLRPYLQAGVAAAALLLTVQFEARSLGNRPGWLLELALSSFSAGELQAAQRYALQAARLAPSDPVVQKRSSALLAALAQRKAALRMP